MFVKKNKMPNISEKTSIEMTEEEYLVKRVGDQIKWYSAKSAKYQKKYKWFTMATIILSALIPLLAGYSAVGWVAFLSGSIGAAISVISGYLGMSRAQEMWITYRMTGEALKREEMLYRTSSEPYDSEDRFKLFVQRIESITSAENANWQRIAGNKKTKE